MGWIYGVSILGTRSSLSVSGVQTTYSKISGTFYIHFWHTDTEIYLKAPLASVYTILDEDHALKRRNFLGKFVKNAFLTRFFFKNLHAKKREKKKISLTRKLFFFSEYCGKKKQYFLPASTATNGEISNWDYLAICCGRGSQKISVLLVDRPPYS